MLLNYIIMNIIIMKFTMVYISYSALYPRQQPWFKVTGTCVYLEIAVTRFMQPMPILTPPSTKSFLGLNPFRPAHIL